MNVIIIKNKNNTTTPNSDMDPMQNNAGLDGQRWSSMRPVLARITRGNAMGNTSTWIEFPVGNRNR